MSSHIDAYLAEIRRAIREAAATDYIMPMWLPFLPLILILIAIVIALGVGLLGSTGIGVEAFSAISGVATIVAAAIAVIAAPVAIYVLYKWIARRNNHFKRTQKLYRNVVSLLEAMNISDPEVVQIRSLVQEMEYEERERSAGLWVILSILTGIAALYVYHFLNKDFFKHEKREAMLVENLSRILQKHGILLQRFNPRVPNRNTILYIILSIITGGLFNLYWVYTLTKDPNEHFTEHRRFDETLLYALEQLAAKTRSPQP